MTTFSLTVSNLSIGVVILLLGLLIDVWLAASWREIKRTAKSNRMTTRQVCNLGGFIAIEIFSLALCVLGVVLMTK